MKGEDVALAFAVLLGLAMSRKDVKPVYRVIPAPTPAPAPAPAPAPTPIPVPAPVQPAPEETEVKRQEVPDVVKKALETTLDVTQVTPEMYQQAKQVLETSIPEPYYSAIKQAEQTLSSPYKEQAVVNATTKASVLPPPPETADVLVTGEGHVVWCFEGNCLFPFQEAVYDPSVGAVKVTYVDGTVNYIFSKDLGELLVNKGVASTGTVTIE
jgi:hypothetical protein